MVKISKFLKPFAVSIAAVVVLLFAQAQCELALPDTMSDIVNVGIQSGGIEDGVLQAVRQSEAEKLFLFMDEEQIRLFEQNYTLLQPQQLSEQQRGQWPQAQQPLYVLKDDIDETERQQLNQALSLSEMIVMSISAQPQTVLQQLNLPQDSDVFAALAQLPQESRAALSEQARQQAEAMGESTLNTAAAQTVKAEYQALGADTDAMQTQYILTSGLRMLGIALLSAACAIAVTWLGSRIAAGVSRDLREAVFRKVEYFSLAEFSRFTPGTLITRTTNDVQQIQQVLVMVLRIVIYAPIIGIGAVMKVVQSNVSMTWIIALVVVVILSIMLAAFTIVMPKFTVMQKLVDKMNSVLREFLDGLPVIRAFSNQKVEEKKFDDVNSEVTKTNLFVNRVMAALMPLMMLVMNCVALLIVWFGGHQMDLGRLQIGELMAFIQYSMQIIMAFLMITMVSVILPRGAVAVRRVLEILNCEPSIEDPQQPQSFDPALRGVVEFRDVSFRYPGAEEDVLEKISFVARPGQTTAFIGSTGSGKSTIVNLVPRFFDVSEGAILVDGVDIRQVRQKDLRDKIGYVPQKGILFSGTIESNLRYSDVDASPQQVEQAAVIAQASEFIESRPEKMASPIAQGGTNVSGGQKQRLSIARALVRNPEIYIFDDSFSALDFKTDAALRRALNELCRENGSTVLLVAQRISSIMHAEQIVVLDQGRIAGIGTHEQLLKNCAVYQEIATSQLSKEELGYDAE